MVAMVVSIKVILSLKERSAGPRRRACRTRGGPISPEVGLSVLRQAYRS
jgi:hypothetical protein